MKPGVPYYQWKEIGHFGHLYTPMSDPMEYDYPFDYQYDSVEEAYQGLSDMGIVEQHFEDLDNDSRDELIVPDDWKPEGWVLVRVVSEVVE